MKKLVNFIEAVNSGKRFRFAGCKENSWYDFDENKMLHCDGNQVLMCSLDTYNSHFEIEDKTITITESHFDEIIRRSYAQIKSEYKEFAYFPDVQTGYIKKEMGF
jgi:hypothetical protein